MKGKPKNNSTYKGKQSGNRSQKRGYRKGGSNPQEIDKSGIPGNSDAKLSSLNDIGWYARNPELLASASRFPFPYKPGMTLQMPNVVSKSGDSFNETLTIPGVMAIQFYPVVGYSSDVNSPISIAAKELYGRVRSKFSGSLDADAPDMMMYNLALDSVHMYIAHLKRIYRALSTYSPFNRDYPNTIVAALLRNPGSGSNVPDNLRRDRTKLWGVINQLVHMANKFVLPKDMDLYERHRWMCEHVYLDSPEPNSQSYVFVPITFLKIDDSGTNGTELVPVAMSYTAASAYNVDALFDFGKELIQALSDWDDAYTISGYYTRAFDGDSMYVADLLLENETLQPVYQPEVLTQIENMSVIGDWTNPRVTQDPNSNALIWMPTRTSPQVGSSADSVFMNLHVNNPTGAEITIASRLMAFEKDGAIYSGTEVVSAFFLYFGPEGKTFYDYNGPIHFDAVPTAADLSIALAKICRLGWFAHHPIVPVYANAAETPTEANTLWIPTGEIENFAVIPKDAMKELHRVCVYSEFNCFR